MITLGLYGRNLDSYEYYHMDEGYWIETAKWTFKTYVLDRNFSAKQWLSWDLRSFGRTNPNAGKLMIGGVLYLRGYQEFKGLPNWDMSKSQQWNIEQGNAAQQGELYTARSFVVFITALTAGILFLALSFSMSGTEGILGGIITVVVFLSHKLVSELGRQVMLDMPAVFFGTAAIVSAWMVTRESLNSYIRWGAFGLITGLLSGFAVSTKLNAGVIPLVVMVIGIYLILSTKGDRGALLFFMLVIVLSVGVFLLLNPQLWPDIVGGIKTMIDFGRSIAERRSMFPGAALWTVTDRFVAFYKRVPERPLDFLLFVFGVIILAKNWRTMWPFLLWGGVEIFAVIWWTPLNWNRYYLPAVPFHAFSVGYVLGYLADKISGTNLGRKGKTESPA
jgi:dolichyl-phosphate-mannose--protein O-mannosyl transferase